MLGRNRSPTAFQRTWSIQTMQKLWFIIPSNRTTSQPTTRGSKSDNLTWLKPGLYFKGRYCHRVVPTQDRACQDHWPQKTHMDMKKTYRSWESHIFKSIIWGNLRVAFSSLRFPCFFRRPVRQRPEQRRWRWVLGSWRFGDINSGIQTGDMTGEFQFNNDWCIAVTFVGRESWLRILVKKIHLRSPVTVPLNPADCFTDGKGRLEELIFMEWDLWCSWVSFQNLSGWVVRDWVRLAERWVLKLFVLSNDSMTLLPNQVRQ